MAHNIIHHFTPEQLAKIGITFGKDRDNSYVRLAKDEYFLSLAKLVSKRSHDAQTQHGCVAVRDGVILSTGYNGFSPNSPDIDLPNIRPHKYKWIVHAEANMICNAAKHGISLSGADIYITGIPCCECTKLLVAVGIKNWFIGDKGHIRSEEEEILSEFLIYQHDIQVYRLEDELRKGLHVSN
jgi:dCMP deaminase